MIILLVYQNTYRSGEFGVRSLLSTQTSYLALYTPIHAQAQVKPFLISSASLPHTPHTIRHHYSLWTFLHPHSSSPLHHTQARSRYHSVHSNTPSKCSSHNNVLFVCRSYKHAASLRSFMYQFPFQVIVIITSALLLYCKEESCTNAIHKYQYPRIFKSRPIYAKSSSAWIILKTSPTSHKQIYD